METISQTPTRTTRRTRDEIQQWLTDYLAFLLDEKPEAVNIRLSFDSHGIDSAAAVSLVADLEEWMSLELDPTIVYDHPTVPELTDYLARQQDNGAT
jgi:acyl carrier protein